MKPYSRFGGHYNESLEKIEEMKKSNSITSSLSFRFLPFHSFALSSSVSPSLLFVTLSFHLALTSLSGVWRKALEELDESVGQLDGLALQAYFIMPVQRLPRYVLLIRDLLKKTPVEHPDYKALEVAAVEMGKAADTLNENIRKAESQVHLFEILERGNGFDRLITAPKQFRGEVLFILVSQVFI